jgi:hypothetical protein
MIQRQQTLWLLLSAVCSLLSFWFPFFSGTKTVNNAIAQATLNGSSTFLLAVCTGISAALSLYLIFLFKNRKLQFRLALAGIALSAILLILYFSEIKKLTGSISLTSLLVFATAIGYIMAAFRIRKDEKLLKSLERLR